MLSWFKRSTDAPENDAARGRFARTPLMMALEPRIMFDAAMAPTVVDAVHATAAEPVDAPADAPAPAAPQHAVVFVDSRVKDAAQLTHGVASGTEVVTLSAHGDGLQQMADYLAQRGNVSSVHVIAHGNTGDLWLGTSYLSSETLTQHQPALAQIGSHIAQGGDILLYACNTAAGSEGMAFVNSLAELTGRDIAASSDRTGAGHDWNLEIATGQIDSTPVLAASAQAAYAYDLATITVTSNADSGAGTLRQAISSATSGDTITFNSSMTISLTTVTAGNMLAISKNLTIDGDLNNDGTADVTLDAQNRGRVLAVSGGSTVTLEGMVLTNGLVSGNGGGFGATTGGDAFGAGLHVSGAGTKVTILGSTITANAAAGGGGGGSGAYYSYGGGGGGGRAGVGGGNGGAYNGGISGSSGSNGSGGTGGHAGTPAQSGKGGTITGGAGGSSAGGFVVGGAGATAGPGAGSSIGGGGGGAGASGGATGGRGGHAAGGAYVGTGAFLYMARSTVSNNWGAGGGGGGGYQTAGGAGGDGAGAIRVIGTFKYQNSSMTFSNNSGVGGSGGGSDTGNGGVAGSSGNSTNNIRTAGGSVDSNWTPPNTTPTLGTVTANAVGQANAGQNSYSFTVTYADSDGTIDNTTIDTNDVTVSKGGTNLTVSNASWNAGTNTATYTVTPDGGTWDDADNGTWTIAVVSNQVADNGGAFVAANASAGSFAVSMDTTGPTVSSVSSSTSNGSYKAGDTVAVTVTFNESVTVTGTPTLTLNSGGTASYASGSGSNTLTFNYTIQGGENTSDLDYSATNSLALSGGTLRDAANNNATLTLPAVGGGSSLGGQKNIVVDTTASTVSSVSATTANGTYKVGDTVAITLTFSETVTVTGTPTLTLNSGGAAAYASGSGSNTLTFNYTIGAGDSASDLDYSATNSLALSGGTVKDAAGNNATLTLPTVGGGSSLGGQKNIVVDGVAPTLQSDTVPSDATYATGNNLDFTVTYSEAVTVNTGGGTPYIAVTLDTGGSVQAAYVSGSGTNTLTFRYAVVSGNVDADGIAAATSITLNGGTIQDAAGNNAATTGISFASTASVLVEAVAPTVSSINRVSSSTTNATSVDYTVTFSENVSGVDTSDFTLTTTGTASGSIASVAQVNASTYTVTVNTISGDGTLRLDLKNAGTGISDTPGNAIASGYTSGQTYTIDNTAPAVTSVGVPANATYISGQNLDFTVNFGEAVTVDTGGGTPRIALTLDTGGIVYADYLSGSGTSALVFRHTVTSGTADSNGIAVGASIDANGGTMRDSASNDASLTLNSVGSTAAVLVDAIAPTVSSVDVPSNGTYITGQNMNFSVNFTENVTVNTGGGTPRIALTLDTGGTVYASYLAGSGTSTLVFRYTVASGNLDSDGIAVGASIDANGGTLRDGIGNDAVLTLNSVGSTAALLVDAVVPTVSSINRVGSATTNATSVDYTVTFSENVSGVDTSDFTLTTTGTAAGSIASVAQVNASTYTVTVNTISGDGTLRLDLKNAGTAISDTPGNAIATGFTSGQTYTIDNTAPAVTSVGVPANATYIAGQNLDFTVNFGENVTVDTGGGTPRIALTLDTGGTVYASYLSGSGTNALVFRHTVASGTADTSGVAVAGSIDANGGTLRDSAGNDATLTLNSVGSTASVLIDAIAPTASIVVADTALAAGETTTVTITFSEAVTGFTNADLTVTNGTLSAVSSSDGGITWTATFTPTASVTDASNLITLDNTGVADAAGNTGTGTTDSNNYAIDTARPTASIVVADTALAAGETTTVTITFSEAVSGLTTGDFTVANGTLSSLSSSDGGVTWTATLTPTASVTDTSNLITLDNTGVVDAAGNTGTGTTDSNNYAIDTARPTASIVVADTALAAGETTTVTITFSEAVTGFTNADLTVTNGTLSAVSSSDGGITWTATFTPTASVTDASNLITLDNTGVTDAAGNTGTGTTDSNNYAIDTARPTASIVVADTALAAGETTTVTITFSEAVTGFTNADLTVTNGTLSAVSSSDGGITWTATFTPTTSVTDASNLITLDNTGVADAAGNAGTGTTDSNNYAIDTARPTASIVVADTALAAGETTTVTITFSEAVSGLTTGDFTVANGTLSGLSSGDGGITWTATFTPTASVTDTSNLITLDNTGVADAAGNAGTGTTDSNNYAIDTARPTASIVVADTALAAGETTTVTITFSEAVSGLATGDFTVANGTLSSLSSSDGGITWTATLTPTASVTDTSNLITLDNTGVVDAAGNTGTGTTDSNNYAIDTARPTASIVVADTTLAAGETTTVTITFSEAVTGFTNADLTVTNGTLSAVSSSDGGITWTATFTPTASVTDASNLITLDNTGVTDAAGNTGTGTTDSNNYAIDTTRPTASIVVADTALAAGETTTVTITFSEAVSGLTTGDFTVANGTLSGLSSGDGGITWTATLTPTASVTDTSNLITLDNTGVADAAGNAGTGITDSNNYAIDTARPTASIVVADTALAAGETTTVTITFSEAVSGLTTGDFTAANGALSGLSSSDGGITWTATLTPTASVTDTSNLITLDNTGVVDAAGNTGTGATDSNNYAIDTARPTASIVVADTALAAGETTTVTITFSEAVSGLTTGDFTVANGTLSSLSSSDGGVTWTATLTPTASVTDTSNLITLDNTGVVDAAGNTGTGTTDSNNYAIDTALPVVTSVTVPANGTYVAGDSLDFVVDFNEAVTVDTTGGTPRIAITLDTGGTAYAGYLSGSGTSALTFRLTIVSGQLDANGISVGAGIDGHGGSLTDAAGNAAVTTLNGVGSTTGVLVDAVDPAVVSVVVPSSGRYDAGDVLTFTVQASEAVTVDTTGGTPRLTLDIGGSTVHANYVSGSGNSALVFQYTVQAGDNDTDGIALGSLQANGGTLRDAAGNDLAATLNAVGDTSGVIVDTTAPQVTGVVRTDASPTFAGTVRYTVTFSEAVTGLGAEDFSLVTTGSATGSVSSVTQIDAAAYAVTVTGVAGNGTLQLNLADSGTGVADLAGNALMAGATGEIYRIEQLPPPPPPAPAPPALPVVEAPPPAVAEQPPVTLNPLAPLTPVDAPTLSPTVPSAPGGSLTGTALAADVLGQAPETPAAAAGGPSPAPGPQRSTFIEIGNPGGAGLQAMPDVGDFRVQTGQPLSIALPPSTFTHSDRAAEVTVEVRLADGRPLPNWLKFDPVSGTISGEPPRGLTGRLKIEVIARDNKGNRASSQLDIEFNRPAEAPRAPQQPRTLLDVPADTPDRIDLARLLGEQPPAEAGRPALASQFERYGQAAREAERAELLKHLQAVVQEQDA